MRRLLATIAAMTLSSSLIGPWKPDESGTKARFRGVSVVDGSVAWASGSQATCLRTIDGGKTWKRLAVPDSNGLDFRDVQAIDDQTAYLLSIGPGELSRIYKTTDGGTSWTEQYRNRDPKGFLDAISFWDPSHGLALGDPINGRYEILTTDDGGKTWAKIPESGMPEALTNEGAFAASGTCLVVQGDSNAWFGTGGGTSARVFRSTDRGRTWSVATTPIRAGIASAGVFGLAFRDPEHGIAVGGDYKSVDNPSGNIALTIDGGRTWTAPEKNPPSGFRSAVAFVPGKSGVVVCVGPSGSDLSKDGGQTWSKLEGPGFHAIGFGTTETAGWGVGEDGRIAKFVRMAFEARVGK
jgi:photosystem II stability/assembly factor-like uncharacterized protein